MRYGPGMDTELKDQRVPLMMQPSLVRAIDAWRGRQPDVPARAEAIRRLIETGLKAEEAREGRRTKR